MPSPQAQDWIMERISEKKKEIMHVELRSVWGCLSKRGNQIWLQE